MHVAKDLDEQNFMVDSLNVQSQSDVFIRTIVMFRI